MVKSFYFVIIYAFLLSCQSSVAQEIGADRLIELQSQGAVIVDIRTDEEYSQGHIAGVKHIDFFSSDFSERMSEFDKDAMLVIHCASGGRSAKAVSQLKRLGFAQVHDYAGGMKDWLQKGYPVEK